MKERVAAIDDKIEPGERRNKVDDPKWTGEHLRPKTPQSHNSPIRLGNDTRLALAIVRESYVTLRSKVL